MAGVPSYEALQERLEKDTLVPEPRINPPHLIPSTGPVNLPPAIAGGDVQYADRLPTSFVESVATDFNAQWSAGLFGNPGSYLDEDLRSVQEQTGLTFAELQRRDVINRFNNAWPIGDLNENIRVYEQNPAL